MVIPLSGPLFFDLLKKKRAASPSYGGGTLLTKEKYYFSLLNPEYNISREPGSPMLGRNHSKETRETLAALRLGRAHSQETRKKLSDGNIGQKGMPIKVTGIETGKTMNMFQ
uniref:Nuclease associated modular domain-containing protein n=1 Tax=Morchella brunnea TaxID=1174671 RepID=A0A8K1MEW2_9PEZI|nr:hypothetical protein LK370_mgp046 [Morchella brunnea]UBU98584.1 hypothetical protein [Morchella brunnea]